MEVAAERLPFHKRISTLFWRGDYTHGQRVVLANSKTVQDSGLADIKIAHWGDDTFFEEQFIPLPQHCRYK